ncbi:MAG: sulfatase [Planctomycetaceae bacterium]|nr:sulfatase [Planctomycetaceae bacterium]
MMLSSSAVCTFALCLAAQVASSTSPEPPESAVPPLPDLVEIPGGEFTMGGIGPEARADEFPRHRVRIDAFAIGRREVTNAEYAAFVSATGYRTIAERAVDWETLRRQLSPDTPKPPDDLLLPGSLVFKGTDRPVSLDDVSQWWAWTPGADWRHPEGPDSNIEGRMDHPVVHIAFEDAVAYCDWIGGRLPTESEWEFAARGGLADQPFIWGDAQVDETRANIWNGRFPDRNTAADGYVRTAPVGRFPANGYGLLDMGGNVWEWCADRYRADEYRRRVDAAGPGGVTVNPAGPADARDPRNPFAPVSRIQRGGSFLCNPSYCSSYRPSARMATTPDSGASHVGFRVAMSQARWTAAKDRRRRSQGGDDMSPSTIDRDRPSPVRDEP